MFPILFLLFFVVTVHGQKTYEGSQVVKIDISDDKSLRAIRSLETIAGFMPDFLGETKREKRSAHFLLEPHQIKKFKRSLNKNGLIFTTHAFGKVTYGARRVKRNQNGNITVADVNEDFLTFDEHMSFMDSIAQESGGFAVVEKLGNSYEGRPLKTIRIGGTGATKPIVWIDSGIHAREWISYNVGLYLAHTLATDPNVRDLLERVEVVIAPNTNPDGYEFSRLKDRMWRKTRSKDGNFRCAGVDGNRNYPLHWGEQGTSGMPCSEIYRGARPASEVEVRTLTTAMTREERKIRAYVALHSYGEDILYPWGYTKGFYPDDVEDLVMVGQQMSAAIKGVNGTVYKVENSGDGLYPAAGAADDWAKSRGIKYSYTIELAPKDDQTHFMLPPSKIAAVNAEIYPGIVALINAVDKDPGTIRDGRRA